MSTGESPDEKTRCFIATGFSQKGFERREVEKRSTMGKEAAHGFRNLSVIKIIPGFEQQLTNLKTKSDKIMNKSRAGENQRHFEQISVQQKLQLPTLDFHETLGNVQP